MKKLMALLSLILVAAFVISACAQKTEEPTKASEAEATELPTEEKVTLRFLHLDEPWEAAAFDTVIKAYQKTHPNVEFEIETAPFQDLFPKIETSVAAGVEYDIIQADGPDMKHYAWNEVLIDVTDHFTEEEMKQWPPQSIEEGSYRGRLYGPPMMQSCSLMWYNMDYLKDTGIEPPKDLADSWTMDEALEAWIKTTVDEDGDGVPEVYGVRWGQGVWTGDYEHGIIRRSAGAKGSPTYQGMGDDGISFVGYLDTDEAIKAMQFYQDMHQKHKVMQVTPTEWLFNERKAAFYVAPDIAIASVQSAIGEDKKVSFTGDGDFNMGATGIPYFADGTQLCHTGSWHWGIYKTTKHFDEALEFVKFASGKEGSRIYYEAIRQTPAHLELLNELPEYSEYPQSLFKEGMLKFGIPRIQTPGYTEYQALFAEMAMNIQQGADVAEQLRDYAQRMEQALAKYKGWNE